MGVIVPRSDLVPIHEHNPHISSLQLSRMSNVNLLLETLVSNRLCLQLESLIIGDITCAPGSSISTSLRKLVQPDDRPPLRRLVIQRRKGFDPSGITWLKANAPDFTYASSGDEDTDSLS
ncbi:hypothetical protein BOTBODRAFT_184321 [Botryobasidium botryosum FD-172 SS1]|uniref:Uncharacterized protein n=1 Tax=Botryobasidium botryosum (strain FD-172 SS1) TaxID=930990 RepID=A0A067MX31_BOTB1|nr:hypothetical protein BOTBODRAFT_184321 [Botryobasidium botryosum FD-172 SS1]